jgi:hypothetical protein
MAGSPPRWEPPVVDTKLKIDKREAFRDLNAARWPSYPLEPTIRSIHLMCPDTDLTTVDIVGCSHTISKLLDVIRGQSQKFRFDADVIGNTVLFTRKGASPTEKIEVQGYGLRFPEAYTKWDAEVQDSVSHQRTINYSFGGLNMMVRSGVSGYLSVGTPAKVEDSRFSDIKPTPPSDRLQTSDLTTLLIEAKGTPIFQHVTFDMKTRSSDNPLDMSAMYPVVWLNQTPNFLAASHEYGLFNKPQVRDVRHDVSKWEQENSSLLARFHAPLKLVIESVRDADRPCEISWDGHGDILITEQVSTPRRALPTDLHSSFME